MIFPMLSFVFSISHLLVVLMTREEERDEVVRKLLICTPIWENQEKHIYYVMRAKNMHVV